MSYFTREERVVYEKRRRDKIIRESRDFRVLQGWMLTLHPDLMADFVAFNNKLRRENPFKKDLSTSPMFRRFIYQGTGTFSDCESSAFFQVDCKQFALCFLGCVMKRTLTVGLRDILAESGCKQESPVVKAVQPLQEELPMTEHTVTEVVQCSDQLPILTDAEVTEVLRGLEETLSTAEVEELLRGLEETFSVAEVDELLRGLEETSNTGETQNTEETLDANGNSQHYVDSELDAVLNMCIDDYIV